MHNLAPAQERDPTAGARSERAAGVAGIASAFPRRVVDNEEIGARLGVDGEWIASRTGVQERRLASADETLVELAAAAGAGALANAGIDPPAVDLILVATITQDKLLPNAAPLVAGSLGAERAATVDVGAACTGFISALSLAAAQVEAGRAEVVLVAGADMLSRVTDRDDRSTAGLFADGAGAVVVTAGGAGSIGPIVIRADASVADLVVAEHFDRKIRMAGRPTFRAAVARLTEVTLELAEEAGVALDEIDLFVYHQANQRILTAVGERLGLAEERVLDCIERYGNTSSATIPIALAEAVGQERLRAGSRVMLGAFGAGLTWGAAMLEWTEAA